MKQSINGSNNIQVIGDYITTNKVVNKTEVLYDANLHISEAQAKDIKDRIYKVAESRLGEKKFSSPPYGLVYKSFYDRYKINSYKVLPRDKFDEAIKWLDKQIAIYRPKLKNVDAEQYRKDMYKSINAKANQLGVNVHEFAYQSLELKKPITSLKELSDTRLKKLYTKLFAKRV